MCMAMIWMAVGFHRAGQTTPSRLHLLSPPTHWVCPISLMLCFPISGETSGDHLQQERPKGTSLQQCLNVSDWWHRHWACGKAGRQWVMGGPEESQTLALRSGPPSSLGLEQPSSQVPGKLRQQHLPQWVSHFLKSS